jgi:hypothetical protein
MYTLSTSHVSAVYIQQGVTHTMKNFPHLKQSIENSLLDTLGHAYMNRLHTQTERALTHAEETQNALWTRIREELKGTRIYLDLNLGEVRTYRDYLDKIAPRDYDFYKPYVEQIKNGETGILFHGKPLALILTSGTTGFNDKYIPYNESLLASFQKTQKRILSQGMEASEYRATLSKPKLIFGANPIAGEVNGIATGYVSGILATRSPSIMSKRVYPSSQTLAIENWDSKVASIAKESIHKDIRMMAGVPAHLMSLASSLLKETGKKSLCEIWPNLEIVFYSGTGVEPYENSLNELAGKKLRYLGMYLASEAPIGFELAASCAQSLQAEAPAHEFSFALGETLLSFVEAENPTGKLLGVHELQENRDYLVHIGTPNGFLQYAMRDVVRVVQTRPSLKFVVQGRQNQLLNIATEKVSMQQLVQTVSCLENAVGSKISHFFVHPEQPEEGKAHYVWHIACDTPLDPETLSQHVDEFLMRFSGDYKEERLVAKHIGRPRVSTLASEHVKSYFERNKNRGQFKMKSVFTSASDFHSFAQKELPKLTHLHKQNKLASAFRGQNSSSHASQIN